MNKSTKKTLWTIGGIYLAWILLKPKEEGVMGAKSDKILFHVYSRNSRALSTYSPTEAVSEAKYHSRLFGKAEIKIDDQVIREFKNGKIVKN